MLVESSVVGDLLDANTIGTRQEDRLDVHRTYLQVKCEVCSLQSHSAISMNPIPALVILFLGIMMTSHAQDSMVSTMIHKQWGNLLTGSSSTRVLTYVMVYLKPPRSVLPSRPPTELLTSFGLISGGILLMASVSFRLMTVTQANMKVILTFLQSTDTVDGMVHYELDPMFLSTVTMGFVGIVMAWILALLALKGWAVRQGTIRYDRARC